MHMHMHDVLAFPSVGGQFTFPTEIPQLSYNSSKFVLFIVDHRSIHRLGKDKFLA